MIGLLLIGAAVLAWWAWRTRGTRALRSGDVVAVLVGLVAVRLLSRGEELPGLLALGGAGWWLWWRRRGDAPAMSREEAGGLLGVAPDAPPEAVRAAHRRLVARVHPDAGGSADLAARVNVARDVLLARR